MKNEKEEIIFAAISYCKKFPYNLREDLIQEFCLGALKAAERWNGTCKLFTFMYTRGKYAVIDKIRHNKSGVNDKILYTDELIEDSIEYIPAMSVHVNEHLNKLDDRRYNIMTRWAEGTKQVDISRELGIDPSLISTEIKTQLSKWREGMIEKWKPIQGNEGCEVSNSGRVRKDGVTIKHNIRDGMAFVDIGDEKEIAVDRLVLFAFKGAAPYRKLTIRHRDNDLLNNDLRNLYYDGSGIQLDDRLVRGEGQKSAKLNEAEVLEIRSKYANGGHSYNSLAIDYDVSARTIHAIITREAWRHI